MARMLEGKYILRWDGKEIETNDLEAFRAILVGILPGVNATIAVNHGPDKKIGLDLNDIKRKMQSFGKKEKERPRTSLGGLEGPSRCLHNRFDVSRQECPDCGYKNHAQLPGG